VVVIGDTPRDVHAAHSIGAECIAVATGTYTLEQLRAAGADYVFADFSQPSALSALLSDSRSRA
jgi:phosphoglycolate phosphatase-like HAD superfamily hydrolase